MDQISKHLVNCKLEFVKKILVVRNNVYFVNCISCPHSAIVIINQ